MQFEGQMKIENEIIINYIYRFMSTNINEGSGRGRGGQIADFWGKNPQVQLILVRK